MKTEIEVNTKKENTQILESLVVSVDMENHIIALDDDWNERFLLHVTDYLKNEIKGTSELDN